MLWITQPTKRKITEPLEMQKVTRLGRRSSAWLALPIAVSLGVATAVLWPQSPTRAILVAREDLSAGTVVSEKDFEAKPVKIGDSESLYLTALPKAGVLVHSLAKGELVTRTSIAPSPLETLLPTVLEFSDALPNKLRIGSAVDVWATPHAQIAEPTPIALECEVSNITNSSGLGLKVTDVEVECLPEFLPALLKAKANQSTIAVVLQPNLFEQ